MRRIFLRLRWQLTLSHLIAITVSLVCMIAAALLIVILSITIHSNPRGAPAADARSVAAAVGGLLPDGDPAALNAMLRALANGDVGVVRENDVPPWASAWTGGKLSDIAYITVVGPDGRVLGSSDPAGAAPSPAERDDWDTLIAAVEGGKRALGDLVLVREGAGSTALGAYPMIDDGGQPVATVIVARSQFSPARSVLSLWWAVLIFLAATIGVLAAAVFALASAGVAAYLLSRRLVARLQRLGVAVDALAAGDLSRRVEEAPADEVGQLGRQFNRMAADLERTLHDLQAERDRVTGLLEARRQLVAGVSHELRTPVATIRGYLESAVQPNGRRVPDHLRADLETMEREVVRLQNLIEDLFTLSRSEVGRLALRVESIDAGAIVCRLTETVAPLAWGQRRVQVVAELAPNLPAARRRAATGADCQQSAEQRRPPHAAGRVGCRNRQRRGSGGTDRDTRHRRGDRAGGSAHIFERYYRGRSSEQGGAGLGLALVKELTVAMGGTVEATSTPGEGSCFTVRFPVAQTG